VEIFFEKIFCGFIPNREEKFLSSDDFITISKLVQFPTAGRRNFLPPPPSRFSAQLTWIY